MKIITYILLTLTSCSLFANEKPNFSAMTDWGGALIEGHKPQHGYFLYNNNNKTYLVLKVISSYKANKAIWKYLDYIVLPEYKKSYRFINALCNKNKVFDGRIAAIVLNQDKEELGGAIYAWTANFKNKKIEVIETKAITCINEGYNV